MKINADLTKVLKKEHEEKWVALNKEQTKVLDCSEKLPKLVEKLGAKGKDAVFMRVLRSDVEYAF